MPYKFASDISQASLSKLRFNNPGQSILENVKKKISQDQKTLIPTFA